ncbi:hypothetical protein PRZ48_001945 [Zasmidium cellare]|uniref:Heterokaryon incompatibility domain-containing protein n=1 Tax=Zasmidium cellare TaxID=395010 RepID=A0ABR0F3C9_ZASCE|nr:hypothetical protein PRZ48_001945 [Zasmidium cellare]
MEAVPSNPEASSLYQSLSTGDRLETRLLTVMPGSTEDPIECALHTVSLDNAPEYNSVSYVWGNGNERSLTHVFNPETCSSYEISIPITAAQSIRRLRLADKPHCLWIDAVCIDQADLSERSHQVANMRRVYAKARANMVQLGHADFGTATLAVRSIHAVGKEIQDESSALGGLRSALYRNRVPVHIEDPLRATIDVDALAALLSSRSVASLYLDDLQTVDLSIADT